jgi:homoserine kinase type II
MLPHPSTIWDIPREADVVPMTHGGYNNHLQRIDVGGAPAYVLRMYGNHGSARMIEHELSVMLQLQRAKLPFAVPAPEITRRGEMCATVHTGEGTRVLVLLPFVKGANPDPADLNLARSTGAAIAVLGNALRKVDVRGLRLPPPYRDLHRVHPLVPEPVHALEELGSLVDHDTRDRINAMLERVVAGAQRQWKELGEQLTHGDIIPGNVMAAGDRVTAILDFENCALNPRVMDLAGALDTWLWDVLGKDAVWERADALFGGYRQHAKISATEAAALPMLIELRNASVLMHLVGRFAAGLSPFVDVDSWLESMLRVDGWLSRHGARLTERALAR